MALVIAGGAPAGVMFRASTGVPTATLASYSPPANALLIALIMQNSDTTQDLSVAGPTNTGTALAGAWTRRVRKNTNASSDGGAGVSAGVGVEIWTGVTGASPGAIVISAAGPTESVGSNIALAVAAITDDSGGVPLIGAKNASSNGSGVPSVTVNGVLAGSYVFACASDWSAAGVGVYPAGFTTVYDNTSATIYSWHGFRTTSVTAAGNQTMNLTSPAAQNYDMAALEIQSLGGGSSAVFPVFLPRNILGRGVRNLGQIVKFRRRVPPIVFTITGSTFTDSMSGSILISGSHTESRVGSNSRTGSILISGSRAESRVGSNSTTGNIRISGTRTESRVGSNSTTGSIQINGAKNETRTGVNSRTGSIQISGSRTELRVGNNTSSGNIRINGSGSVIPVTGGTVTQDFVVRQHGRIVHDPTPND